MLISKSSFVTYWNIFVIFEKRLTNTQQEKRENTVKFFVKVRTGKNKIKLNIKSQKGGEEQVKNFFLFLDLPFNFIFYFWVTLRVCKVKYV